MDVLKSLAITGVILIHVSAGGYGHPVGSFHWLCALFWGSVSRASVPIFLMLTGALMLDPAREVTIRQLWLRKIPRLLAALLSWALIYRLRQAALRGGGITAAGAAEASRPPERRRPFGRCWRSTTKTTCNICTSPCWSTRCCL